MVVQHSAVTQPKEGLFHEDMLWYMYMHVMEANMQYLANKLKVNNDPGVYPKI